MIRAALVALCTAALVAAANRPKPQPVVDVPFCPVPFTGIYIPCRDADAIVGTTWDVL